MFFKSLYTRWDEMNLRNMTPKRVQIFRDRWAAISRFGTLSFVIVTGSALATLMMGYGELLWLMAIPHRFVWNGDLLLWAALGFAMAILYCVAMKAWARKIEIWRSAGRLSFPPAAQ